MQDTDWLSLRVLLIGDTGSGKTCLIAQYYTGAWLDEYIPDVYNCDIKIMVDGYPIYLSILDSAADDDIEIRCKLYENVDSILICFDLNKPDTFYHVKSKWKPELDTYCPNTPYILVGNKCDIRDKYFQQNGYSKPVNHYLDSQQCTQLVFGYIRKYSNHILLPDCLIHICCSYYFISIPITTEQGIKMKNMIGAQQYIEKSMINWVSVFDPAVRFAKIHMLEQQRKSKQCIIL